MSHRPTGRSSCAKGEIEVHVGLPFAILAWITAMGITGWSTWAMYTSDGKSDDFSTASMVALAGIIGMLVAYTMGSQEPVTRSAAELSIRFRVFGLAFAAGALLVIPLFWGCAGTYIIRLAGSDGDLLALQTAQSVQIIPLTLFLIGVTLTSALRILTWFLFGLGETNSVDLIKEELNL